MSADPANAAPRDSLRREDQGLDGALLPLARATLRDARSPRGSNSDYRFSWLPFGYAPFRNPGPTSFDNLPFVPLEASARPLFARCLARSAAIAERKGADVYRRRLLAGLTGRVVEVGAGTGIHFRHYPGTVTEVLAVEPEPNLRAMAEAAAGESPVAIRVVSGMAEALPVPDASVDACVSAGLLCSVPDPAAALAELARVIRSGGELRFFEHVISRRRRAARLQSGLDASGVWARAMGGCRTSRDTEAAIARAGFRIKSIERFTFHPTLLDLPVAPKILGRARRE